MSDVKRSLIIASCVALYERDKNHGCWLNGIPDCFEQLRVELGLPNDGLWVLTVETYVKNQAALMIGALSPDKYTVFD